MCKTQRTAEKVSTIRLSTLELKSNFEIAIYEFTTNPFFSF